jgi:serine/threonine-protein kinase
MVQHGWLTVYQMNQLLAGHGLELVVGPYQVQDWLGQGGQSTVYLARHARTGVVVALKVIRGELVANAETSRQFMQEMEAMASLHHPNVVQFFDADRFRETCYCALEYVAGTDLGKYVRLIGPLPAFEACDYVRQTALGLQHAHERNLIHRDIKPVNLFLTTPEGGTTPGQGASLVKILDWGLASLSRRRATTLPNGDTPSTTKAILGTADYLSPEQALNPDGVDIRSDIYSLGCTFYFLLTSQPPFADGTVMQKILKHQGEEPRPVDTLRPDLPLGLASIVRRMLAKRPEDRFQTPDAAAVALTPYCHADRFLLPRLNREIRQRLGLEADSFAGRTAVPNGGGDSPSSTFGPRARAGDDTAADGTRS